MPVEMLGAERGLECQMQPRLSICEAIPDEVGVIAAILIGGVCNRCALGRDASDARGNKPMLPLGRMSDI